MCLFPESVLTQISREHSAEALAHYNGVEIIPDTAKEISATPIEHKHSLPIVSPIAAELMKFANKVPHGALGSFASLPNAG